MFYVFRTTDTTCQYLTIAPYGTQIKKLDSGIIFTCNIVDVQRHSADMADNDDDEEDDGTTKQPPPDIRWVGPDMEYISRSSGRFVQLALQELVGSFTVVSTAYRTVYPVRCS